MAFYFDFSLAHQPLTADSPELETAIQNLNLEHTWIIYLYVTFIFVFFVLSTLFRRLYIRKRRLRQNVSLLAGPYRYFRRWTVQKACWPWTTRGHMLIVVGYILLNIIFCMMSASPDLLFLQLARKTGWLSSINFTMMLLMSMKNTPLSKLTGYSYERLNVFHRWLGGIAWVQGCVHTFAIGVATSRLVPNQSSILINSENIMGIIGLCLWSIAIYAFPLLKARFYEWFYAIHIGLWPLIAVALYLHNSKCQIPILIGVCLVLLDRLIRTNRLVWHNLFAKNLKATIETTKDGATLVTVPRGSMSWMPGSHAFLSIPSIRYFQSHPFTIASVTQQSNLGKLSDVQFIIRPKQGFTKALYQAAKSNEDLEKGGVTQVPAYIDGPYGGVPDFNMFSTVILIAAGSGITFTLPVALSLVRRRCVKSLHFVWSVRDRKAIDPVRAQLEEICTLPYIKVRMSLQITGETKPAPKPSKLQRMSEILTKSSGQMQEAEPSTLKRMSVMFTEPSLGKLKRMTKLLMESPTEDDYDLYAGQSNESSEEMSHWSLPPAYSSRRTSRRTSGSSTLAPMEEEKEIFEIDGRPAYSGPGLYKDVLDYKVAQNEKTLSMSVYSDTTYSDSTLDESRLSIDSESTFASSASSPRSSKRLAPWKEDKLIELEAPCNDEPLPVRRDTKEKLTINTACEEQVPTFFNFEEDSHSAIDSACEEEQKPTFFTFEEDSHSDLLVVPLFSPPIIKPPKDAILGPTIRKKSRRPVSDPIKYRGLSCRISTPPGELYNYLYSQVSSSDEDDNEDSIVSPLSATSENSMTDALLSSLRSSFRRSSTAYVPQTPRRNPRRISGRSSVSALSSEAPSTRSSTRASSYSNKWQDLESAISKLELDEKPLPPLPRRVTFQPNPQSHGHGHSKALPPPPQTPARDHDQRETESKRTTRSSILKSAPPKLQQSNKTASLPPSYPPTPTSIASPRSNTQQSFLPEPQSNRKHTSTNKITPTSPTSLSPRNTQQSFLADPTKPHRHSKTSTRNSTSKTAKPLLKLNLRPSSYKPLRPNSSDLDPLARYYRYGRPDLPEIIKDAVAQADEFDTVAVGTCGVTKMVDEVRAVAAGCISSKKGPSVSVFCEEFGW